VNSPKALPLFVEEVHVPTDLGVIVVHLLHIDNNERDWKLLLSVLLRGKKYLFGLKIKRN